MSPTQDLCCCCCGLKLAITHTCTNTHARAHTQKKNAALSTKDLWSRVWLLLVFFCVGFLCLILQKITDYEGREDAQPISFTRKTEMWGRFKTWNRNCKCHREENWQWANQIIAYGSWSYEREGYGLPKQVRATSDFKAKWHGVVQTFYIWQTMPNKFRSCQGDTWLRSCGCLGPSSTISIGRALFSLSSMIIP